MKKYSCIIPAFNEKPRILEVLKVVIKVKELSEVVCVDDGSTDGTVEIVKVIVNSNRGEGERRVKLIRHRRNLGKLAAIRTGLRLAKNQDLLLLDADLVGLDVKEVAAAIKAYESNRLDCLVLTTRPMDIYYRLVRWLFRATLCVAGNRIINKQLLMEILRDGGISGYQLEVAQNKYLMETNKKVSRFELSAVDLGKTAKKNLWSAARDDLEMWRQIVDYAGLPFFIKMSLMFARRRVGL